MIINNETFIPKKKIHKESIYDMNQLFKNPLIHRQITGDEIYVPLNTKKLWGDLL